MIADFRGRLSVAKWQMRAALHVGADGATLSVSGVVGWNLYG